MMSTIFSKIISGEIPVYRIYEDEKTVAFMDIHPIKPGHVLVIPKVEVAAFEQLEEDDYQALMATVKLVAQKIKSVLKPLRVGVIIEGFEVEHAHVKVLPINSEKELRRLPETGESADPEQLQQMAERLKIN